MKRTDEKIRNDFWLRTFVESNRELPDQELKSKDQALLSAHIKIMARQMKWADKYTLVTLWLPLACVFCIPIPAIIASHYIWTIFEIGREHRPYLPILMIAGCWYFAWRFHREFVADWKLQKELNEKERRAIDLVFYEREAPSE